MLPPPVIPKDKVSDEDVLKMYCEACHDADLLVLRAEVREEIMIYFSNNKVCFVPTFNTYELYYKYKEYGKSVSMILNSVERICGCINECMIMLLGLYFHGGSVYILQ